MNLTDLSNFMSGDFRKSHETHSCFFCGRAAIMSSSEFTKGSARHDDFQNACLSMRFRFCFCREPVVPASYLFFAEGIVKLVFPVFTILFYAQLRPEPPRKNGEEKGEHHGKNKIPETGIYDARQLGTGRMLLLGFQHMFAMFGATILVPILTGLDVSTTLLFAGLGTLLFHLITGGKVPAFLGSSFAFLGGYATIAPMLDGNQPNLEMLPLRLLRRGVRRSCVRHPRGSVQGLRREEGHALLPADRHRPDHHRHRPEPLLLRHQQLHRQLVDRHRGHPHHRRRQHLGQGHDQDHPDPPRRHRLVSAGRHLRSGCPRKRRRQRLRRQMVRAAHPHGADRLRPVRLRQCRRAPASDRCHHHRPAEPCHHGRAHRRRVRDLLHLQPQLH